jgi:hypothetical protein
MVNYLLSIFFVFRLMDETGWNSHTLPMWHHPPAPIRFHTVCIHLLKHFTNAGDAEDYTRALPRSRPSRALHGRKPTRRGRCGLWWAFPLAEIATSSLDW